MMGKVVLGLSGGVDSSEAARRLREAGFEVLGVWLDLGFGSPAAAERTARELGIPFRVFPAAEAHEALVRRPFGEAYLAGLTPNPCAVCNPRVKLPSLLRQRRNGGRRRSPRGITPGPGPVRRAEPISWPPGAGRTRATCWPSCPRLS